MGAAGGFVERCIPVSEPDAWREALKGIPHAFAHTAECSAAIQLTTGWPTFLYVAACASGRVVCPFSERSRDGFIDVVTPYQFSGFTGVGFVPGFSTRWRDFTERRGFVCAYIAQHPAFVDPLPDDDEVAVRNTLYLLDLTPSVDELLRGFDSNRRRQLRQYASYTDKLIDDRSRLADFLMATYPSFATRVGTAPSAQLGDRTLSELALLPNVTIVGVGETPRIEAVCLVGHTRWVGDLLLNVATVEGRRHATTLLWYCVLALKTSNIPVLNLGGGTRQHDGVAQSKQRFRARPVPFRVRRQIFRHDVYSSLCKDVGIEYPESVGYFPAYRWTDAGVFRR